MSNPPMKQAHNPHPGHAAPLDGAPACAVLGANDLSFSYPGRPLFSRWSARIVPGLTLVRGGDGSGKTSLLRLLAGELPADSGALRIHGVSLGDRPEAYRAQVFFTEPRSSSFDALTTAQYLETQRQRYPGFDAAALDRLLAALALGEQIGEQMGKQLFMLSTGSKRKLFLAAAFASGAPLTLLDMPFAALDKASIACVTGLLAEAASHTSRAWVMADHSALTGIPLAGLIDLGG